MAIKQWSTTAADNTASPPTGAPEGMAAASVNNTMREMMADIKDSGFSEDTVALMKGLDVTRLSTNTLIMTRGYDAAGDGGGRFYKYDSAAGGTDNGGTIIAPTAGTGRFLLLDDLELKALLFGALNDGITQYTSEIQAMFDVVDKAEIADWFVKGRNARIETGKRITIGSFQTSFTGIIPFEDLDWPLNTTVQFQGGTREMVHHMNHIADGGTPVNEFVLMAPFHPGLIFDYKSPAAYSPFVQEAHGASASQSFGSIVWRQDGVGRFQLFTNTDNGQFQLKSFPIIAGGELSKCFHVEGETGDMGIQVSTTDTVDNAALMVGGSIKIRSGPVSINGHETNDVEPRLYLHDGTSGQRSFIGLDASSKAFKMIAITSISGTSELLNINGAVKILGNGSILPGGAAATWSSGADTPEAAVTAVVGSLWTRTNGGANTTLYVKESGSGNTGWVAK